MFLPTTTVCFSRLTQSDKHTQYTFSSDSFSSAPPLGNKMHSLEATGQDYVRIGTIVYEFVHRILLLQSLMPSSSSLCLPFCDGIRLLFSTDEENPYLLLSLKEGRDRLILITSGGDFRLWFPGWKLSNIFHFSGSTDRKTVSMNILCKIVVPFFFTFVFPPVLLITSHLVGSFALPTEHFFPKSITRMMNLYYT